MFELIRYRENPILERKKNLPWAKGSVLNPSVFYEEGIFKMAFRATNDVHISKPGGYVSSIGYAESIDGINFNVRPRPIIEPEAEFEANLGCEDPRITKINGKYYMYYTAVGYGPKEIYNGWKMRIALAVSRDFINWTKCGIAGPINTPSKAACLFPEKINRKYVFLYTLIPDSPNSTIMIAEFEDEPEDIAKNKNKIVEFDDRQSYLKNALFKPSGKSFRGPEVGAVPIKTGQGWLLIYCPENATKGPLWTIGAALLDLENPRKIIAVSPEPILSPVSKDEISGVVDNVTFPEGAVVTQSDGIKNLYVYYGSGDQGICLATCKLDDLINHLLSKHAS